MKRKLILIACVLVAVGGIGLWRLNAPFRLIRQLDTRYQQVQRGMTTNEVQAVMNHAGHWHTNAAYRGWDGAAVSAADTPRIGSAVAYSVPTFFLGVTFEFTFDENGKVIGKHRYD